MGHCTLRKLFGFYPYSFKDQLSGYHRQKGMAKVDPTGGDAGKKLLRVVGITLHVYLAIVLATLLYFFMTFTYAPPYRRKREYLEHQKKYYTQRGKDLLDDAEAFDPKDYYGRPDPLRAWNKGLAVLALLGWAGAIYIFILLCAYGIAFYSPWRPKEETEEELDPRKVFYGDGGDFDDAELVHQLGPHHARALLP